METALIQYVEAKLAEAPELARKKTKDAKRHIRAFYRLKMHAENFMRGDASNRLVVFPGIRGVGKTTALLQLYRYLTEKKRLSPSRVLYFSADEMKNFLGASIYEVVKAYVESILRSTMPALETKLWILIDEAHYDEKWDTSAKIIYDQSQNIFLLLTGSSALSIEMGADLARRAVKEPAFPLSFSEHIMFRYREKNIKPPKNTAQSIREALFHPTPEGIDRLNNLWGMIKSEMLRIGRTLNSELEHYLTAGGFPFCIGPDVKSVHSRIFSVVERILERDLTTKPESKSIAARIIYHIATQKPGSLSDMKLSSSLEVSSRTVRSLLDMLVRTHLVFSIKPYRGAARAVRSPWKYYFLAPSIGTAIRAKLGFYRTGDRDHLGVLAENMVAAGFFRMKETSLPFLGIFYDPEKGGADFILELVPGEIIPVEVALGRKSETQVRRAMDRYGAKHGVVISGEDSIYMSRGVLHIPLTLFGFC